MKDKLNAKSKKALNKVISKLQNMESRAEQTHMAQFITRFLNYAKTPGHTALIEAGTGIGKSLGYLTPLCEYIKTTSETKTVIATNTISLQEQLIKKDIPILKELYSGIRFEKAKGRNNYICKRRLVESSEGNLFSSDQEERDLKRIKEWLKNNQTGDKADMDFEIDYNTWKIIESDVSHCYAQTCPYYSMGCYLEKAKKRLKKADIIVTNHAMVLTDLQNKILPDYSHIVIDEAHNFEKNALRAMTVEISTKRLNYIIKRINSNYCQAAIRRAKKLSHTLECIQALEVAAAKFLGSLPNGRIKAKIDEIESGDLFLTQLGVILGILKNSLNDDKSIIQTELKLTIDEVKNFRQQVRAFTLQELSDHVYWAESNKAYYAPIHTAFLRAFWNSKTSVLTSATLSVAGSFKPFIYGLNLNINTTYSLKLNSPFDYMKNALVYTPAEAVSPKNEGYTNFLTTIIPLIIKKSGGKTFVLFTSFALLNTVYDAVKSELSDYNLLKQGQGNKEHLLRKFKTGNSVLFGTDTFWEGVDEDINCVIITKLPFAVPTDPIEEARYELLKKAGKNPFMIKSIPGCALKLKQGAGRLIRNADKRGVIVICDPRIKAHWGRPIIETLPNMRWTSNPELLDLYFPKIS